jgi:hypothetical protein
VQCRRVHNGLCVLAPVGAVTDSKIAFRLDIYRRVPRLVFHQMALARLLLLVPALLGQALAYHEANDTSRPTLVGKKLHLLRLGQQHPGISPVPRRWLVHPSMTFELPLSLILTTPRRRRLHRLRNCQQNTDNLVPVKREHPHSPLYQPNPHHRQYPSSAAKIHPRP